MSEDIFSDGAAHLSWMLKIICEIIVFALNTGIS